MTERACHVFLVGEGPSDIGDYASLGPPLAKKGKRAADRGFVVPVLRRIAAEHGLALSLSGHKLASLPKQPAVPRRPEDGLAKKARAAMALASQRRANVLVMVHDVDREQGVTRSAREGEDRHDALRKAMQDAASSARTADDRPRPAVLVGAPLRMIEAWALGDPQAVQSVAEQGELPPAGSPEALWGSKHDPESDYPKHVLARCLGQTESSSETYARIAEAADLDVVADRCPVSFRPFLESARELARACATPKR